VAMGTQQTQYISRRLTVCTEGLSPLSSHPPYDNSTTPSRADCCGSVCVQLKDQALKVMLVSGDCFLIGLQVRRASSASVSIVCGAREGVGDVVGTARTSTSSSFSSAASCPNGA
jgi:hypothetical protein